jgi:hypothetical protein
MYVGATYIVPSGPNNKEHLHVVVAGPNKNGTFIWVSVYSVKNGIYHDPTCILNGGSHPFLPNKSYIAYNFATFQKMSHLNKMVGLRYYRQSADLDPADLARTRHGMDISLGTPKGTRKSFIGWPDETK